MCITLLTVGSIWGTLIYRTQRKRVYIPKRQEKALFSKLYCKTANIMTIKQTSKDSNDSLSKQSNQKMNIALLFKSYTIKASSLFILISLIAGIPTQANAGFLNDLVASVVGTDSQSADASEDFGTDNFDYNSQNMQVLETTSVDPNTKNVGDGSSVATIDGGVLSTDSGTVGSGLESVSSGEMTTYTVKEGDTLSEIAMQYDISTNTIRWENNITGNNIKVGQKLNILPVTGVKHIIKSGDTLDKIADKYDAEVEDIMVFNGVTKSDKLKAGDVLYVPNGIIKPVVATPKPTSGSSTKTGNTSQVTSGYYSWPAAGGKITSPYGPRKLGYHYGIDIGAPRGTTVYAAASGIVTEVVNYCSEGATSCGGRYGNYIVIRHSNGTFTRYAHLSRVSVSVGNSVSKGKKIGAVGNTGRSTGPHLHFQIEKANGATIRPRF